MNRKRISSALIALVVPVVLSCGNMEMGSSGDQGSPRQPTSQVMTPGTSQSGSRLKRMYTQWATEDGLKVVREDTNFWDDQFKITCSFAMAEDSQPRCLPIFDKSTVAIPYRNYFLDPLCKKHFLLTSSEPDNCTGKKINFAYLSDSVSVCSESVQSAYTMFAVGDVLTTPSTIYQISQNKCEALDKNTIDALLLGKQVLEVLEKIEPTSFVKINVGTYQYPQ